MMIRFVGNDAEGRPLKRRQSHRACERCRKRKKRCPHLISANGSGPCATQTDTGPSTHTTPATGTTSPASPLPTYTGHTLPAPLSSSSIFRVRQRPVSSSAPLSSNPVINLDDEDAEDSNDREDQDPRFVGELNPEGIFVAGVSPENATTVAAASSPGDVVGIWVPRKLVNAAQALPGPFLPLLLPYLEDECSRILPTVSNYNALHRLYTEEVHPMLPVLNVDSLHAQSERSNKLLKLAICLSVSSNPRAASHLPQSPTHFSVQTTQLLRSAIDNGLIRDRQVIMQLLIVLALSTQLSDDRHASPEFTARAITYIQTGGLHLDTSVNPGSHVRLTQLFCCAFTLDRLNAAVQGRPVLMHERDLGRDMEVCIGQQNGLFQLLLRVILILDKVIALYRPSKDKRQHVEQISMDTYPTFPTFEDLLGSCGTLRAPASLVATVEMLYHAVVMLSCRSQSLSGSSRNSESHVRQNLSADSVVSILGDEYRNQLSVLPFVPYAMSLALRVSYRNLRLSKSSFTRARARRQLLNVCSLLRGLGDTFSSSLQMVELAEQTVREMDRAYSNMAGQKRSSVAPAVTASSQDKSRSAPNDEDRVGSSERQRATLQATERLNGAAAVDDVNDMDSVPDLQVLDAAQFDLELDVFDYFDPEFDIHAIDVALANSIDPALPVGRGSSIVFGT